MDEATGRNRRLTGWLLAIGSPGVAAGLTETMLASIRATVGFPSTHPTVTVTTFAFWTLLAATSAAGGWLITFDAPRPFVRFRAILAAVTAGTFAYIVALGALDFIWRR